MRHHELSRPRIIMLIFTIALLLSNSGCARFPAGTTTGTGRQLTITMTVAGQINPNDFYYVVINNANDSSGSAGPVPVIGSPWGNGFVAGSATSFVEYTGSQPADGYLVYDFQPSTANPLLVFTQVGTPVQDTPVNSSSNTLEFRVPLSQLATTSVPLTSMNDIQINFINTNQVPVNTLGTLSTPKLLDALGNTLNGSDINHFITIPTAQDGTFSNSGTGNIEPSGDIAATTGNGLVPASSPDAPNLDITNWSVQVSG
jgi:hypothetical protein